MEGPSHFGLVLDEDTQQTAGDVTGRHPPKQRVTLHPFRSLQADRAAYIHVVSWLESVQEIETDDTASGTFLGPLIGEPSACVVVSCQW